MWGIENETLADTIRIEQEKCQSHMSEDVKRRRSLPYSGYSGQEKEIEIGVVKPRLSK